MLGLGGSADDEPQATPPAVAAPSSQTEAICVPEPSSREPASPAGSHPFAGGDRAAPEAGAKARPGSGDPSAEEDDRRRRGRPERAARVQGGPAAGSTEDGAASAEERGEEEEEERQYCGRERLKRHRVAMAGRVWIPDTWGQESLLKDWADCAAVDRAALVPSGLLSAREALVEECRREEPGTGAGAGFWIESSCLSA